MFVNGGFYLLEVAAIAVGWFGTPIVASHSFSLMLVDAAATGQGLSGKLWKFSMVACWRWLILVGGRRQGFRVVWCLSALLAALLTC